MTKTLRSIFEGKYLPLHLGTVLNAVNHGEGGATEGNLHELNLLHGYFKGQELYFQSPKLEQSVYGYIQAIYNSSLVPSCGHWT